jgi:hypothetical protein
MTKLAMNPVNWFEIPASDLERATRFYEKAFEIELEPYEMEGFRMVFFPQEDKLAGAGGSIVKGEGYVPSHHGTMVYFSVEDIEKSLKKIKECGGRTLQEKMSIGPYGFVAHFEDCEGNKVSLHSKT